MVHFYHSNLTPRWKYVLDFVFTQRGIDYKVYAELSEQSLALPDLISIDPVPDLQLKLSFTSTLLEESSIHPVRLDAWESNPQINGVKDFFGGIFYVLTQYEQYTSYVRDKLGRFPASASVLKKEKWLHEPIADVWAEKIIEKIEQHLISRLPRKEETFQMVPSFDIDNAFAFKGKGLIRNCFSMVRDFVRLDWNRVNKRITWSLGLTQDPYDSYGRIQEISEEFNIQIFWLTESSGGRDNNLSIESKEVKKCIGYLKEHLGLHPSFGSEFGTKGLGTEKEKLSKVSGQTIDKARMHYLRLDLPETYRSFLKHQILEDHSIGFADEVGFRIGTARRVPWFDLEKNEATSLQLQPFVYMDGSLNEYMKLSIPEAKSIVSRLYREVEKYGGNFVFLWHNETITDFGIWKGWTEVLNHTLELGKNGK